MGKFGGRVGQLGFAIVDLEGVEWDLKLLMVGSTLLCLKLGG